MPASVSTPSTSTHSRRTLRARSDTVTAERALPIDGFGRQQRVGRDIDRGYSANQVLEAIGGNAVAWTLGGQHLRADHRASRDVPRGDDAFAQSSAYLDLGPSHAPFGRAQGGL